MHDFILVEIGDCVGDVLHDLEVSIDSLEIRRGIVCFYKLLQRVFDLFLYDYVRPFEELLLLENIRCLSDIFATCLWWTTFELFHFFDLEKRREVEFI